MQWPVASHASSVVHGLPSVQSVPDASSVWTQLPVAGSQESVGVHVSPSSQLIGVWLQPLAGLQMSTVQKFPSSQLTGCALPHDPAGSQTSLAVHALPSSQGSPGARGWPTQTAASQTSETVQAWPSSHGMPVVGVCTQPTDGSYVSDVQGLPSSQPGQ
jgi:hypothetical protein